jgi:hypothetical protein
MHCLSTLLLVLIKDLMRRKKWKLCPNSIKYFPWINIFVSFLHLISDAFKCIWSIHVHQKCKEWIFVIVEKDKKWYKRNVIKCKDLNILWNLIFLSLHILNSSFEAKFWFFFLVRIYYLIHFLQNINFDTTYKLLY